MAAARRNSISGTAEFLHLTQPTLSRQLKELKEKPGKQLFIREIEEMITEAIDCGSIDFGIVFGNIDTAMYDSIPVYHQEL